MARLTVIAPQVSPLAQLIDDYIQDRRARGVSRKTITIYRARLTASFLPLRQLVACKRSAN